jgi:RecA-family ATPase
VTTGLTILAGAPKLGKSWFALGMAFAISVGGRVLGDIKVSMADVLYLALEDTPRRLQGRMVRMGVSPTVKLRLMTEWPHGPRGILALDAWMLEHPETRAVIVDTVGKMSGVEDGNSYQETYRFASDLKRVADRHEIAVVAITHSAKIKKEDWTHNVIGSVGTIGAADTIMVMTRPRGCVDGILSVTGRDVVEEEAGIRFDPDVGTWTMLDYVPKARGQWRDGKAQAAGGD